ncbi:MAG: FAD-dependent oxidoreductase [Planctomycetota bacterium]
MRIAIVGTGIAGLVSARLLCRDHDLTVFEAADYIGGHTHTIDVEERSKTRAVDTGFIVFNEKTYPNLIEIFRRLNVKTRDSKMSFSVSCKSSGYEYNAEDVPGLLAQPENIFRPRFWKMIFGILKFYKQAPKILEHPDSTETLGDWLVKNRYSKSFIEDHLIPMAAAVWSTPIDMIREYPLLSLVRFFNNHGFLQINDRPMWKTVVGGSRSYIAPLIKPFKDRIYLNSPILSVHRKGNEVVVKTGHGEQLAFDRVILACHGDQSLRMLKDANPAEREILGKFRFSSNPTTLHRDTSLLPSTYKAWAAWNVALSEPGSNHLNVSYWMNCLQGFTQAPEEYIVTLNQNERIDRSSIIQEMEYHHPLFDQHALEAQSRHQEIDGKNGVHFCGAYWGNGFHEDGVNSALEVAKKFGRKLQEITE